MMKSSVFVKPSWPSSWVRYSDVTNISYRSRHAASTSRWIGGASGQIFLIAAIENLTQ